MKNLKNLNLNVKKMENNNKLSIKERSKNFLLNFKNENQRSLLNYMKQDKNALNKFLSWINFSITKIPSLLNDKESLVWAVIWLAQIWLTPWISDECYILPYKGKASAVISYKWYVTILFNAWVDGIYWEIVYEKDKFTLLMWLEQKIIHEIDHRLWKKERWNAVWAYVVISYKWKKIYKYMSKDDILEFREYSQSYSWKGKKYSPWNPDNDPQLNMWKKTVLKQVIKFMPQTPEIYKAQEMDNIESPYNWKIKKIEINPDME